jgi:hypothetical protein
LRRHDSSGGEARLDRERCGGPDIERVRFVSRQRLAQHARGRVEAELIGATEEPRPTGVAKRLAAVTGLANCAMEPSRFTTLAVCTGARWAVDVSSVVDAAGGGERENETRAPISIRPARDARVSRHRGTKRRGRGIVQKYLDLVGVGGRFYLKCSHLSI